MRTNGTAAAPTGRKQLAQGKKSHDTAFGPTSQNTSSPEEAKKLPHGWRNTTVDESITIIDYRGRTPPFDGTAIPHLRSQNVKSGRIVWNDLVHVSEETYDAFMTRGIPQLGDLLFTTEAPLGEVSPVPKEKFSVAQRIIVLRPAPEFWFSPFLMYQLMSPQVQARIRLKGTGSTVTGVSSRNFKPVVLHVAPLPEQRRIVAEIEKQFTRLEAGVEALRRVQVNLRRYRAAVLKAACEGRLVPTEAELHLQGKSGKLETGAELLTRILVERRKNWTGRGKYKEPTAPDTANLPRLPKGWMWASLEQLSVSSSYGTSAKCSYENSGPPVLRIPNISSGKIDLADLKFAGASEIMAKGDELRPGDLIIIRTNGSRSLIGRSAVIREKLDRPTDYASYLIRFRLIQEPVVFGWVGAIWDCSLLRTWIEQRAATSAGQHNISMSVLSTLPIPVPPLAEQTRIVAEVERRLSMVDELEATVKANLQRAARFQQSILQKAFTGQL